MLRGNRCAKGHNSKMGYCTKYMSKHSAPVAKITDLITVPIALALIQTDKPYNAIHIPNRV